MKDQKYLEHSPVLYEEILELIGSVYQEGDTIIDGTFGYGGHSFSFLENFKNCKLYCCDQDDEALLNGYKKIKESSFENIKLFKTNYVNFPEILNKEFTSSQKAKAILLDVGVSSHQLDAAHRGFSLRHDGKLDMRMNFSDDSIKPASFYLNTLSLDDLSMIIKNYGEDKFHYQIARSIVSFRENEEIINTKQLENIVFHAYPKKLRFTKVHPATKTFQALRIFVNKELEVLEKAIEPFFNLLDDSGILMIISFHSLEDRIVKQEFKKLYSKNPSSVKIITKRPIIPTDKEITENKRARSSKMRVIQYNANGFKDDQLEEKKHFSKYRAKKQ